MAFKDKWEDKVNGRDDVDAEDINMIANAVIDIETDIGDIDTALDQIIAIQNTLIGGENA